MAVSPVFVETDFQRLVVERALVLAQELEATAGRAADGQVLWVGAKGLLLTRGRGPSSRRACNRAAQHSADEAGKKGVRANLPLLRAAVASQRVVAAYGRDGVGRGDRGPGLLRLSWTAGMAGTPATPGSGSTGF